MPLVAQIGDTIQSLAEARFEWKIHDFFSLSDKVEDCYESPVFGFADSRWYFKLYPNEKDLDRHSSEGWVGLYLNREDKHPVLKTVYYTFGIKCSDGRIEEKAEEEEDFSPDYEGWGDGDFWCRSELQTLASKFMPDNILTITCRLKCREPNDTKVSLSNRLWKASRSMKTVLSDGKHADFTLKLGDRKWPVHKAILESRSEYFASMLSHQWVENTEAEVKFEDMDEDVLDNVLNFIYTGEVEAMFEENVFDIYVAAHKFLLDDLKALCIEFMKKNICGEIFCKVLVIADTYGERDLNQRAIEYFNQKADQVFESDQWQELKKSHPSVVAELLEETTKRDRKRRTNDKKQYSGIEGK